MMSNEPTGRMPPAILFRSFLIVGGGYALSSIAFAGSIWLVSRLFFPEIHGLFNDQERLVQVMANTPEDFYTRPFFLALLFTNIVANAVVGFVVARFAPFAKLPHAVFVAIAVLIYFLQQSMTQEPSIQWMFALMMVAFPLAILIGARAGVGRPLPEADLPDESAKPD